jgi:cytoskeleton protein RodZ
MSARHRDLADLVPAVPDRLTRLLDSRAGPETAPGGDHAADVVPKPAPAEGTPAVTPLAATPLVPVLPAPTAPAPTASAPVAGPAVTASAGSPSAPSAAAPPTGSEADAVPPVDVRPQAPAAASGLAAAPELAQPTVNDASAKAPPLPAGIYGAQDGQARVVLHAVAASWIQVRDGQGSLLITRVLKPGETYNVPNQDGLTMVTGNAGGLDIAVDGATLPRIGESGRVARNVSLSPERLLAAHPHAN